MKRRIRIAAGILAAVMAFGTCTMPVSAAEDGMPAAQEGALPGEGQETGDGVTGPVSTKADITPAADTQDEENGTREGLPPEAEEGTEDEAPAKEAAGSGTEGTGKETAEEEELFNIEEGTAEEALDADEAAGEKEPEQADAIGTAAEKALKEPAVEEAAVEETAVAPTLVIAPDAEGISSGTWQEVTGTVHHDEEGHYEKEKTGETEVVDKEAWDERVKRYFYECTVCLFRDYTGKEIGSHVRVEHPTGHGNHYYNKDGKEIYPSYRDEYEIIIVHHDAETHMEDVYEDVWKVDQEAWDETTHSGVYKYYVNGTPVTGTLAAIDGETYLFDEEGVPMTGWRKVGDDLYYFGADGKMQTGWHTRDGIELYNDPETGKAAFGTVLTVDGTPCFFNSEGTAFTEGLVEDKGREYYFDGKELAKEKWIRTDAGTCYFDADGTKVTGVVEEGGKVYPVGADGALKTSRWVIVDGNRYYTDENGAAVTGWHKINGRKYYFTDARYKNFKDPELGRMMTGWASVGNRTYYFADSRYRAYTEAKEGIQLSGWKMISDRKYYFMDEFCSDYKEQNKGILLTGFRRINGKTHYLTDERAAGYKDWKRGIMLSGHAAIGGNGYYFSDDGVMVRSGWIKLNGRTLYFDKYGRMRKGFLKIDNRLYYFDRNGALAADRWVKYGDRWRWADSSGVLR